MNINIIDYLQGNRLAHCIAVEKQMNILCDRLKIKSSTQCDLLKLARFHDIGYSKRIIRTGFHPLDGFLFLQDKVSPLVSLAVLFHTNAKDLSNYKGREVNEFYKNLNKNIYTKKLEFYIDAITYCDIHIDSKGNQVTIEDRFKGILHRYGSKDYRVKVFQSNLNYYKSLYMKLKDLSLQF